MARALRTVIDPGNLTVVVNVGDDTERYGVYVSADPDTVMYTLAGVEGPHGWGRDADAMTVMDELSELGVDTTFRLGDADLAVCLARTAMLANGDPLSMITGRLSAALGVTDVTLLPSTDDRLETHVRIAGGEWLPFQEYFVDRQHRDRVEALAFHGSIEAAPAPGVIDAIASADVLLIAPSNPPLSIWPILAIDAIRDAVDRHPVRAAVSPLFGGRPLKGPADEVMKGVGLSGGTRGILEAYRGIIDHLFIDNGDGIDIYLGEEFGVTLHAVDTLMGRDQGQQLANIILEELTS
ncbi:MAG: 2-phospho-L-lactate transferase CofD family protein [Actinomycetia bacterium]|nr:2-phospho-L-lactate transferase CofD family protein [Actinomycetes bacterium]